MKRFVFTAMVCLTLAGLTESGAAANAARQRSQAYLHYCLAKLDQFDGHEKSSVEHFKKVLELDESAAQVRADLAELYQSLGKDSEALKEVSEAVKADPSNVTAWEIIASIAERTGDTDTLIEALEKLTTLVPDNPQYSFYLATLYQQKGRTEEAIGFLELTLQADPLQKAALETLFHHYAEQNNPERISPFLDRALSGDPADPELLFSIGSMYVSVNQPLRARQVYDSLLPMFLRDDRALERIGDRYVGLQEFARAEKAYRRAMNLSPFRNDLLFKVARANHMLENYDEALRVFNSLIERLDSGLQKPEVPTSFRLGIMDEIGQIQLQLQRVKEAISTFEEIKRRLTEPAAPSDGTFGKDLVEFREEVSYWLSRAYLGADLKEKAFLEWKEAVEGRALEGDRDREAWIWYIELAFRTGRHAEAEDLIRILLDEGTGSAKPGRADLRVAEGYAPTLQVFADLSILYRDIDRMDKSLEIARKAMETFEDDVNAALLYAYALSEAGQTAQSKTFIRNLLEQNPENRLLLIRAISHHQSRQDFEEIIFLTAKALERWPDDDTLEFQLGSAFERAGDYERSDEHLERAITLNPRNMGALNWLGYSLADRGVRLKDALEFTRRAVNLDNENGAYLDSLGWVYFKLGRYDLAEENLLKAARLYDGDHTIHEHLGDLYSATGKLGEAIRWWKSALQLADDANKARIEKKLKDAQRRSTASISG